MAQVRRPYREQSHTHFHALSDPSLDSLVTCSSKVPYRVVSLPYVKLTSFGLFVISRWSEASQLVDQRGEPDVGDMLKVWKEPE